MTAGPGPTYNAADRDLLPGGSSAGTATAVAASLAVLGLAEETGGSIQNPAAAQALVGIKPSFGARAEYRRHAAVEARATSSARSRAACATRRWRWMCWPASRRRTRRPSPGSATGREAAMPPSLDTAALKGKRIGLYGPGWRDQPLSPRDQRLYERATGRAERRRARSLVEDPFAGLRLRRHRARLTADRRRIRRARPANSCPTTWTKYLERLGPDAALKTFAEFAAATAKEDPFGPDGVLRYMPDLPEFRGQPRRPAGRPTCPSSSAARGLSRDLRRGLRRAEARRARLPADARRAGPLHGDDVIDETDSQRDQHRRPARRDGAGRLLRARARPSA